MRLVKINKMVVVKVGKDNKQDYTYINQKEVIDAVKKLSGVPKYEIEKVFKAYAQLITKFASDRRRPSYIIMSLPCLGRISFEDRYLKKGRVFKYHIKDEFGNNDKVVNETIKYQVIKFNFIESIPKTVKKVTRKIVGDEE